MSTQSDHCPHLNPAKNQYFTSPQSV
uniref:Uncharacterized protein n=1 Tax=Rhizophora mucronata TaxID=61149 RepID=A0A2P2PPB9_RHIMU